MPLFLKRLLGTVSRKTGWFLPLIVALFVFFTAWPLMALVEPSGAPIVRPQNFFWYFVVTSSTVGYGDFYPATLAGHVVGVYVILGGIATITAVLARLTEALEKMKGRRMRGRTTHELSKHLVILGYHRGRTEQIVRLLGEDDEDEIVLCAWDEQAEQHPIPEDDRVHFVRGDLTDIDVLARASIADARVVLVDADTDDQALTLLASAHQMTTDNHIVVGVRDMERAKTFAYVDPDVRCVQWHSTRMICEEIADPGISRVYNEIMGPEGRDTYSFDVPRTLDGVTFGAVQSGLGHHLGALALAVAPAADDRVVVSPTWDTTLRAGDRVFYIGDERLGDEQVTQAVDR